MLLHSGIVLMLIVMIKQVASGNGTDCSDALGMESGKIKDSQITISSVSSAYGRLARLNKNIPKWGAWCFDPKDLKPVTKMEYGDYIKIDLLNVTKVTKVATQGRGRNTSAKEHTTKYKISYSDDNSKWIYYKDRDSPANTTTIFDGNSDVSTVVSHILDPVIVARYIRIHPGYFVLVVCLRLELYGCKVTPGSTPTNTPSLHKVIETPSTTSLSTDFSQTPSTTSLNTEPHECSKLLPILIGLVSLFCLIALIILALLIKWKLFNSKQPTPKVLLEMESTSPNPDNNVQMTATSSATQASSRDAVVLDVPPDESDYVIPDPLYTELSERTDDGHVYQKLIKA